MNRDEIIQGVRHQLAAHTLPTRQQVEQMLSIIDELKRSEEALHFLDRAARLLRTSVDSQSAVAQAVRLAVPFLADCCAVNVVAGDHTFRCEAAAHADPAKEDMLRVLQNRFPLDPSRVHYLRPALHTGQPVLLPEVTEELLEGVAPDPEHRNMLRHIGIRSAMVVPLVVPGRIRGTVMFVRGESGRRCEDRDLAVAQELATHIANAVENGRLDEEVQQALAARDEFLSLAAHELRSPLATLVGYLRLLEQRGAPLEALPQLDPATPHIMAAQAERLNRLLDALLDLARIQSGQLPFQTEPVDLITVIGRVVERLEAGPQQRVVWQHEEGPLTVSGDVVHLEQVVYNLVDNALKYSPASGRVTVWAGRERAQAVLVVRDEGIGIPKADQAHLFQRFYRAGNASTYTAGGLGIGLYLAGEIVRHHGGQITVQSTEGQGSTFTVRLPLA
jgi:signal transduction histidine kinase